MSERWGREQVLALAPDAAAVRAAESVARPPKWDGLGGAGDAIWGECRGSGARPYQVCAELTEPTFLCTCPSRKFPCKHALALALLWSEGAIPAVAPDATPPWAADWLAERRARAGGRGDRGDRGETADDLAAPKTPDPKTAERRERRVDDGVAELDRWLRDQVTHGLTSAERASYQLWDDAARRLVDAQAPGLAGQVRALAGIPRRHTGWPERLLAEYALLHLLVTAHRRRAELPAPLRDTVRARIGFTVAQDEVLRGARVRDRWFVAGTVDTERDNLIVRRVWLRGRDSGRPALVLTFGAPGRSLDVSLVVGTTIDADLAFYPGAQPLRALVAERHGVPGYEPPAGTGIAAMLDEYAAALARDPWLDRWPAVLREVRPARGDDRWHLLGACGTAVPLATADPWRLLAASGGRPMTVAGEWTPGGLVPLSGWCDEGRVIL
ncbi:MAG TPA: SWIM zinc finger family protein [Streptosporangiaceae bacterium]|nr:SWIM zinc finger family protein [Streptosporangiaceae bacterium]